MKRNAMPDSGDGPERDELGAMLRHWSAPAPPAELEDALRREFRRRRPHRRRALWVGLAAAAVLLVAWQLRQGSERPEAPRAPAAVAVAPSPAHPAVEPAARDRAPAAKTVVAAPSRPRRRSALPVAEPPVIVEPDQAALLVELGRKVWETRQAVPGTVIPQMPEGDLLRYRDEWQTEASQSSFGQEPGAIGER